MPEIEEGCLSGEEQKEKKGFTWPWQDAAGAIPPGMRWDAERVVAAHDDRMDLVSVEPIPASRQYARPHYPGERAWTGATTSPTCAAPPILHTGICVGGPCAGQRQETTGRDRIAVVHHEPLVTLTWNDAMASTIQDVHVASSNYRLANLQAGHRTLTFYMYDGDSEDSVVEELLNGYNPRR